MKAIFLLKISLREKYGVNPFKTEIKFFETKNLAIKTRDKLKELNQKNKTFFVDYEIMEAQMFTNINDIEILKEE